MEIVVNDTNIFIDLHSIGLLDQFFESARPCENRVKKRSKKIGQEKNTRPTVVLF